MKLSVVIVSYNVKFYIEQCIKSILRSNVDFSYDIWVVDNVSSDDSVSYLKVRFPEVHFIVNKENVGFSRANNQAIAVSRSEYVLLLNPDTIVGEHVLSECVHFMDAHPQAGATGVAMLKDDGGFAWESRRGLPTPFTAFCKMSGLCALFPKSRLFGRYYMRYLDENQVNEIEVISGAFNMLRRSVLNKVGFLDEDFFMYGEDIDLSYRILKGGYHNYYLPVQILHYKGESTKKSSFRYVHVFYDAMLIFFNKHYRDSHKFLGWLVRLAVVVRGVLDYCKNQKEKLSGLMWVKHTVIPTRILCLGHASALKEMENIASHNHLKCIFYECDEKHNPQGHLEFVQKGTKFDYVVYDVESYSMETMLRLLHDGEISCGAHLGVYHRSCRCIITHKDIWR